MRKMCPRRTCSDRMFADRRLRPQKTSSGTMGRALRAALAHQPATLSRPDDMLRDQ